MNATRIRRRSIVAALTTILSVGMLLTGSTPLAHAGAVGGAKSSDDTVKGNSTDVYKISFRAGEEAVVRAKADGADIDLYVYDESGNLIDKDDEDDDNPVCIWTPRWTGRFTIKVVNCTPLAQDYALRTN